MKLSRRTFIKSGTAAIALSSVSGGVMAFARPTLIVFDSRVPASCAFARRHSGPRIDVALEDQTFWRTLRSAVPDGPITGMTGWSDWVMVRGLLEEQGKRLKSEAQSGPLFHWAMA